MSFFYNFSAFTVRNLFKLLYGIKLYGTENLNFEGPALLASNHISLCDPPLIGSCTPFPIHFMAKSELFENKFFGGMIRALNAFPVKRGRIDRAALAQAQALLERGSRLLMFPEGTRQKSGIMAEARPGAGKIAIENGVPVLPVYVSGANRLRKLVFSRRHICICYGQLIESKGFMAGAPDKERIREFSRKIMDEIKNLKNKYDNICV